MLTQVAKGAERLLRDACAELEKRLRAGENCCAKEYLASLHQIAVDSNAALDLIYTEYLIRSELGETALATEFFNRYPEHREALQRQLHFHRWAQDSLGSDSPEMPSGPPLPRGDSESSTNRFEIVEELGRGGIGVVYLAWEIELNRLVALKMVLAGDHASKGDLARFRVEAEAVARLNHPNIVPVYSVGEQDGRPCLALEYVPGGNLAQRLAGRPFSPRRAATIVSTVARAVQYAHERGILHRDLKPANVLLTDDDTPKLTDFSLAKLFVGGITLTQSGSPLGTPNYMAPCQIGVVREEIGPATDVYGLGGILYETLTGQPPFRADTVLETLRLVETADPVPPSRLNLDVPRDLETICLKCLRKLPIQRYGTPEELANDLDRWLTGKPIQARAPAPGERLLKLARRHPLTASMLAVVVLTIVCGFWLVATNWQRAVAARQEALFRSESEIQTRQELAATLYFNRIALAERETSANNFSRADKLLEACEEGRRGWEWYYLKGLRVGPSPSFAGHEHPVTQVVFGKGGLLASGSQDRTIKLWGPKSGQVRTLRGHADSVQDLAFSSDGRMLASVGEDSTVRLWNMESGLEERTLKGHRNAIFGVAFNSLGQLATAGADHTVKIWDVNSGKEILTLSGHRDRVYGVAFSPDGLRLASASRDRTIRLWDTRTGKELRTFQGHEDLVRRVAFSPDGMRVASASHDQTVRIWDVNSGGQLHVLQGHTGYVYDVAFSPDGSRVASGGWDKTVKLWDAASGREAITLRGHIDSVQSVAFNPEGHQLASGGNGGLIRIWDAAREPRTSRSHMILHENMAWRSSVTFSTDGKTLLTGNKDGTVQVQDVQSGRVLQTLKGHADDVLSVAYRSDGARIVSGSDDGTARVWDAVTGVCLLTLSGHTDKVRHAIFSPDGRHVATASEDRTIRIWDAETGKEIRVLRSGNSLAVVGVSFSADGRRIASASWDRSIKIWGTESGGLLQTLQGHELSVWAVAFSPDGLWLASAGGDGKVIIWDSKSGNEVRRLSGHSDRVFAVTFSPDSSKIATASEDQTVRIWDTKTGKEQVTLRGHTDRVWSVAFAPDGKFVVSSSKDKTLRIWNLATEEEMAASKLTPNK